MNQGCCLWPQWPRELIGAKENSDSSQINSLTGVLISGHQSGPVDENAEESAEVRGSGVQLKMESRSGIISLEGSKSSVGTKSQVAVAAVVAEVSHHQSLKHLRSVDQQSWKGMVSNSEWMSCVAIAMCLPAGVKAQPGADGGGGWDFMDVLMVLGFIGYSVLAMGLGAMLYWIFQRIQRQAAYMRGLLNALDGVFQPPPVQEEHEHSDGKGKGKGEGKSEGKFPGKHPSGRPWTDEEVDEYHNDLIVANQLFMPGSLRRRRPSSTASASDGGPPRDPEGRASMWASQVAGVDPDDEPRGVWADPESRQASEDSDGSHYFRNLPPDSDYDVSEGEYVPPHILRWERKGGEKGKGKKGRGRLVGPPRPGEGWRRFAPSRSTTPSPGRGGAAASTAGLTTSSTSGTVDYGEGDVENPFLDGEPYSPTPPREEPEEEGEEEEEADPRLATVEEGDEEPDHVEFGSAEMDEMWDQIMSLADSGPAAGPHEDQGEPAVQEPQGGQGEPAEPGPEPGPAQPGPPADGPPGPMVFTAPTGTVYHRRRNCGKLLCARRVIGTPGCPVCSGAGELGVWRIAYFGAGFYHVDENCPRRRQPGQQAPYQRPACQECGGYFFE